MTIALPASRSAVREEGEPPFTLEERREGERMEGRGGEKGRGEGEEVGGNEERDTEGAREGKRKQHTNNTIHTAHQKGTSSTQYWY